MNKRPSSSDLCIISNCDTADTLDSIQYKKLLLAPKISFKVSPSIQVPVFNLNMSSDNSIEIINCNVPKLNKEVIIKINNDDDLDESNSSINSIDDDYYFINDKDIADVNYNKESNGTIITSILAKLSKKL